MRTRQEITDEREYNAQNAGVNYPYGYQILEVLLDIRELLEAPALLALGEQLKTVTDSYLQEKEVTD